MSQVEFHVPVMCREVLEYLNLKPGQIIIDATVGTAGHAQEILKNITPGGRLICIDRDEESLSVSRQRLKAFGDSVTLFKSNFADIDKVLKQARIKAADGILFDLGISSFQLSDPQRGFSFQDDGPLDMRMDRSNQVSGYDLINNLTEEEISDILWNFGQERFANRIARSLVYQRKINPISTTQELSDIVVKALPYKFRYYRIHPATRTFQAVRIAVNREIDILESTLGKAIDLLEQKGGRICVISFHSLEDRAVKLSFRKAQAEDKIKLIVPKPQGPGEDEIKVNPSSRSAKLRVAERL